MEYDPTTYIIAAALLGSAISFMAACLILAGRVRDAYNQGWRDGVNCTARDNAPRL